MFLQIFLFKNSCFFQLLVWACSKVKVLRFSCCILFFFPKKWMWTLNHGQYQEMEYEGKISFLNTGSSSSYLVGNIIVPGPAFSLLDGIWACIDLVIMKSCRQKDCEQIILCCIQVHVDLQKTCRWGFVCPSFTIWNTWETLLSKFEFEPEVSVNLAGCLMSVWVPQFYSG